MTLSRFCHYEELESKLKLPKRIVEGHAVDDVAVLVEAEKFLTRIGVPYFASSIVAACDELIAALVKSTVG
jgi:hypothetical protein